MKEAVVNWPAYQDTLEVGEIKTVYRAGHLLDNSLNGSVVAEPAAEDVPETVRIMSGRWEGWAGAKRNESVALQVEKVRPEFLQAVYAYQGPTGRYWNERVAFYLVGDAEWRGRLRDGPIIGLRLRPDRNVDFVYVAVRSGKAVMLNGIMAKR